MGTSELIEIDEQRKEIERLKYHYHALENAYKAVIEECARVVQDMGAQYSHGRDVVAAIRALKNIK